MERSGYNMAEPVGLGSEFGDTLKCSATMEMFERMLDMPLSDEQMDGLQQHLDDCPTCAALSLELMQVRMNAIEERGRQRMASQPVVLSTPV